MQITNATNMLTGYTMGMKPDGRECIVVVAKATFDIPEPGRSLRLSKKQAPLVMADEFTGEPGYSATLYEVDYAPFKPKCDVLFNGSAYAPRGRTAEYVDVSLSVGEMTKSFSVVGNRHYGAASYVSFIPSAPEPFEKLPFSYDNAWGGCDAPEDDPENGKAFMGNPVGCGYYPISVGPALEGKPLPNTFEKVARSTRRPETTSPWHLASSAATQNIVQNGQAPMTKRGRKTCSHFCPGTSTNDTTRPLRKISRLTIPSAAKKSTGVFRTSSGNTPSP